MAHYIYFMQIKMSLTINLLYFVSRSESDMWCRSEGLVYLYYFLFCKSIASF